MMKMNACLIAVGLFLFQGCGVESSSTDEQRCKDDDGIPGCDGTNPDAPDPGQATYQWAIAQGTQNVAEMRCNAFSPVTCTVTGFIPFLNNVCIMCTFTLDENDNVTSQNCSITPDSRC